MPCLIALFALFLPRVTMVLLYLLSDYLQRAFQTALWPLLGFIFMPYTTLAYAWAINSNGSVSGVYLFVVIIAALVDLGVTGGSARARRERVVVVRERS
jgi:hypothetical protein